jgi:5-amino-6-(5-phospho-D-ribitylamino)uracil phosphatase
MRMAKGLIAIDLDGTALDARQKIPPRTKRALKQARAQGYEIVIATGRPPRASIVYHQELGLESPFITFNGLFVHAFGRPDWQDHSPLDRTRVLALLEACHRFQIHNIMMEIKDEFYVWKKDEVVDFLSYGFRPSGMGPVEQYLREDPTVLMVRVAREQAPHFMRWAARQFRGEVEMRYWDGYFQLVEIRRADISKATALAAIARRMGVARERVIAFGDSDNDREMLEWAGLGVAMGNAPEELKRRADDVTETNEKEGIAVYLEKVIL